MPTYRYTGAYPKHLHGLTHGVNAHHQPADGTEPSAGTITAHLGDHITAAEPYEHPDLKKLEDAITDVKAAADLTAQAALELIAAAGKRGADGIEVLRAAAAEARQEDEDHQRMTAEGAPAPTEQE